MRRFYEARKPRATVGSGGRGHCGGACGVCLSLLRVVSNNTRGLRLREKLADKARRLVVDKLLEETDILRLQETFSAKQDLDKLNSVNSNSHGAGESTTDLSLELVQYLTVLL